MNRAELRSRGGGVRMLTVAAVVLASGSAFPVLGDWDDIVGEVCGDGIAQPGEECDPGYPDQGIPPDMLDKTCGSEGYNAGELACTPDCRIDDSACHCIGLGAPLSYTDNGDGTITDVNTGLMWEKKDSSGGIHHMNNTYTFEDTFSVFIEALNNTCEGDGVVQCDSDDLCGAGGQCGFAGYRDWRMPNVKELLSIVNYEVPYPGPTVAPSFDTNCVCGCTVQQCSCTRSCWYWSSSSDSDFPRFAWPVSFLRGAT